MMSLLTLPPYSLVLLKRGAPGTPLEGLCGVSDPGGCPCGAPSRTWGVGLSATSLLTLPPYSLVLLEG